MDTGVEAPLGTANLHLAHISHLASQCSREILEHESRYKQAYTAENTKLAQSVETCKALELHIDRLNRENRYFRDTLIPDYDRLVSRMTVEIMELQKQKEDQEKKSLVEKEEHRVATEAMIELLAESNERLENLEAESSHEAGAQEPQKRGVRRKRAQKVRATKLRPNSTVNKRTEA